MTAVATSSELSKPKLPTRWLDGVWEHTWRELSPLGLRRAGVPAEFAVRQGAGGRFELTYDAWRIGDPVVAECRILRVVGVSTEIIQTFVIPKYPEEIPVFAAELTVFGDLPRSAFVDLQAPGLKPAPRVLTKMLTRPLAERFRRLPRPETPAHWTTQYSAGHHTLARLGDVAFGPCLAEVYRAYLSVWIELTARLHRPSVANSAAALRLDQYKHDLHARARARVAPLLDKLFGAAWSTSFLKNFFGA